MNFEFATASRIVFGVGSFQKIGPFAAELGWRALVVSGLGLERTQPLLGSLAASGVVSTLFLVDNEPTVELVQAGVQLARRESCDLVIGYGGGSAIDAGKAIGVMLRNPGSIFDYLEVVGKGQALIEPAIPIIAVPTTAGTGAEVTRNAVLGVPDQRVKVSLRSPTMLPRLALVDPELTYSLPPMVTASTGLDALTQLIEPFVSNRANPVTDAVCREGLRGISRSLLHAYEQGTDASARQDMSLASLFGGLALANAKLGAVHGIASVLGGMFPAPHGAVCARLLPEVIGMNVRALQQRDADNPSISRFHEISRILTGDQTAEIADGVKWIQKMCVTLKMPPLSAYGLTREDIPTVVEKSARSSSMQGNPIALTSAELVEVLEQAI